MSDNPKICPICGQEMVTTPTGWLACASWHGRLHGNTPEPTTQHERRGRAQIVPVKPEGDVAYGRSRGNVVFFVSTPTGDSLWARDLYESAKKKPDHMGLANPDL